MRRPIVSRAFTLIEMLVVVAIIAIIAGFAVPALVSGMRGSRLNDGASVMSDAINLARQTALSKGRVVEVRFLRFADPEQPGEKNADPTTWQYRAMQAFEILENGVAIPSGKFVRLPDTLIMNPSETLSTLLQRSLQVSQAQLASSDPDLPRGVKRDYEYSYFRFYPDGSTNLSVNAAGTTGTDRGIWFVTIHSLSDLGTATTSSATMSTPPANFFTLQVDPVSGTTKSYRPGIK